MVSMIMGVVIPCNILCHGRMKDEEAPRDGVQLYLYKKEQSVFMSSKMKIICRNFHCFAEFTILPVRL